MCLDLDPQGEPGFQGPAGPRGAPGTGFAGDKVHTDEPLL